MKTSLITAAICGTLAIAAAGSALATTTGSLKVYDGTDTDMIAGNGIPIDNFTQATGQNGMTISLKARNRGTGEPTSQLGNIYYVEPGCYSGSVGNSDCVPNFSFDAQGEPGSNGDTNFHVQLQVDFDPTLGTDYATIDKPLYGTNGWCTTTNTALSNCFTPGHEGGGGTNAWNTDVTPGVLSNSGNLSFSFWEKSYDPNADGNYRINFSVWDPDNVNMLASTSIFAIVGNGPVAVPEPAVLGTFGLGLLGVGLAVAYKRRRKDGVDSEA